MDPTTFHPDHKAVAIVAWSGMDLTDFAGPVEALHHANDGKSKLFKTTVVSATDLAVTNQKVSISRHIGIEEGLERIDTYDVLIVPGGAAFKADDMPEAPGMMEMIEAFAKLPARPERPRAIMSICAGACYLGVAGLLKSKVATTHPMVLGELQTICDRNGGATVVRQHYVDGGPLENGTGIITSGGIASGYDAGLYLTEVAWGREVAERSSSIMDLSWRREALPFGFAGASVKS